MTTSRLRSCSSSPGPWATVDEALPHLDRLIKDYPADPVTRQARVDRGRLLFQLGRFQAAIETLKDDLKVINDPRTRAEAGHWLGRACYTQKRYPEALEALDSAEKLAGPGWFLAALSAFYQGRIFLDQNPADLEKAARAFARVVELEPKGPLTAEALVTLGTIHREKKNDDLAMATFDRVRKDFPASDEALKASFEIAAIELDRNKPDAALQALDPRADKVVAGFHQLKGHILYQLERWSEAAREAQIYLDDKTLKEPDRERGQILLGLSQLKEKGRDRPTAIDSLEPIVAGSARLTPKGKFEILHELVVNAIDLARDADADQAVREQSDARVRSLSRRLKDFKPDPNWSVENLRDFGVILERDGSYKQAEEVYTSALVLVGKDSQIEVALHVRRAAVRIGQDSFRDALDDLRPILALKPGDRPVEASYLGGRVKAVAGFHAEAVTLFLEAAEDPRSGPFRPKAYFQAARSELVGGHYVEARRLLARTLESDPDQTLEVEARILLVNPERTGEPASTRERYRAIAIEAEAKNRQSESAAHARSEAGRSSVKLAAKLRLQGQGAEADHELVEALKDYDAILKTFDSLTSRNQWVPIALFDSADILEKLNRKPETLERRKTLQTRFPGFKKK